MKTENTRGAEPPVGSHTPTPRPWKVGERGGAQGVPILAGARFGYVVARISGYSTSDDKDEANASLIVRAVNAHDALVVALKTMLVIIDRGGKPYMLDEALTWRESNEKAHAMADNALALAEGKQ